MGAGRGVGRIWGCEIAVEEVDGESYVSLVVSEGFAMESLSPSTRTEGGGRLEARCRGSPF